MLVLLMIPINLKKYMQDKIIKKDSLLVYEIKSGKKIINLIHHNKSKFYMKIFRINFQEVSFLHWIL